MNGSFPSQLQYRAHALVSQSPLRNVVIKPMDNVPQIRYMTIPVYGGGTLAIPNLLLCFSPCGHQVLQRHKCPRGMRTKWLREVGPCTESDNRDCGIRLTTGSDNNSGSYQLGVFEQLTEPLQPVLIHHA